MNEEKLEVKNFIWFKLLSINIRYFQQSLLYD